MTQLPDNHGFAVASNLFEDGQDSGQKTGQKQKMTADMAEKELRAWVTRKQGSPAKLTQDLLEPLVQIMCAGDLILKEDLTASYTLRYPVMGEVDGVKTVHLNELNFKERLKYHEVKHILKRIDPNDTMGQGLAYTAGLTNVGMKILEQMDMYDLAKVQSIAVFFIT